MKSIDAPPKASILIESMRDIGYTLETALADVVDNSISAGASVIHIHADTCGAAVRIGIVDNGRGMTETELIDAMRLGSRNPLEPRASWDLGRFGLGMKTASFSQCRRLTVMSRCSGKASAAIWDLDHVAERDAWSLLRPDEPTKVPFAQDLLADGSLVVWERLDRAVEHEGSEEGRRHFAKRMEEVHAHLALVFHRYLSGESGIRRVEILINNIPIKPFDPFHSSHAATMRGQTERLQVGEHTVEITTFTLPHHRNVSAADWERYGGQAGYLKNQGFYLYREKRLIVHGTWFGLARQMELTKLTRVRIDMPSGLDAEWQVDVKKASARPPLPVRERLQRIVAELGAPSRRIFTMRGRRLHDGRVGIWQRVQRDNQIVYALNPENPALTGFAEALPAHLRSDFGRLLQAIAAALPTDAIFADLAGTPDQVQPAPLDDKALESLFAATWSDLCERGHRADVIRAMLQAVEPFRSNWDRSEALIDRISNLQ